MNRVLRCVILLYVSLGSFVRSDNSENKIPGPAFHLMTPVFPEPDPGQFRLVVAASVPHSSLRFVKDPAGFRGSFEILVTIADSSGTQVHHSVHSHSVEAEDYERTKVELPKEVIADSASLPIGAYDVVVRVTDHETRKTSTQTAKIAPIRLRSTPAIGDLVVATRDSFQVAPPHRAWRVEERAELSDASWQIVYAARVTPGTYSRTVRMTSSSGETVETEEMEGTAEGTMIWGHWRPRSANLGRGRYRIEVTLNQSGKISLATLSLDLRTGNLPTHMGDLQDAIRQLRYIASRAELRDMEKARGVEREDLFRAFWRKKDPTPDSDVNEVMNEFYRRVAYANRRYGTFREGWETPMGMIFILFGLANDIETNLFARDGRSYQKWHYYSIGKTFVFVDYNGFGEYELMEPYYPVVH